MSKSNRIRSISRIQATAMLAVAVLGVTSFAMHTYAENATIVKNNDTLDALDSGASWLGGAAPNLDGTDSVLFNNNIGTASTFTYAPGAGSNWNALLTNNTASITITAGSLFTLGAGGIGMTGGTMSIASSLAISAPQNWIIGTSSAFTATGAFSVGTSNTLTITTVGTASAVTISGALSGNSNIIENGLGNVTIGANTNTSFLGTFTVNGGTLTMGGSTSLGTAGGYGGIVTLNNTGALSSLTNVRSGVQLIVNGTGNKFFGDTNTWVGAWTGSGTITTDNNGLLMGGTTNALAGFNGLIIIGSTTTSTSNGMSFNDTFGTWGSPNMLLDLSAGGRVTSRNGGTITLASIRSTNANSSWSGSNGAAAAPNKQLLYVVGGTASAYSTTFAGTLTDFSATNTLGITKIGSSTLTLSNTFATVNGYTGGLRILDGTVEFGNGNLLGSPTTLTTSSNYTSQSILLIGDTNGTATTLRYIGNTATSTGDVFVTNSNAVIDANGTAAANTLTFSNGAEITPSQTGNSTITLGGNNTGPNTFNPSMNNGTTLGAGIVSLVKADSGTWVLSGTGNGYTGSTTVTGGSLFLNMTTGGLTGTSSVTFSGSSFGGQGLISGPVSLNSGHLVPGPGASLGVGTLTLASSLNMSNGTFLDLEFVPGNGGNDRVAFATPGALTLGTGITASAKVAGTSIGFYDRGSFAIFTNISSLTGAASNISLAGGDPATKYTFSLNNGAIYMTTSSAGADWLGTNSGNWSDAGNWVGGVIPGSAIGDIAAFDTAGLNQANVTLNGTNRTLGILSLNPGLSGGYILSGGGGSLFMNNGTNSAQILNKSLANAVNANMEIDSQNLLVTLVANTSLSLGGIVSSGTNSTAGITITGATPSTLTLAGNNTYAGATTIPTGFTVNVGTSGLPGGTLGATSGTVSNNGTVNILRSDSYSLTNSLTGSGAWNQAGTGTTTLDSTRTNNTLSGAFSISAGDMHISNYTLSGGLTSTGGTFDLDTGKETGTITISGTGKVNADSTTSVGTVAISGSGMFNSSPTLTAAGNISVANSGVWTVAPALVTSGNITINNTGSFTSGTSQTSAGNVTITDSVVFTPSVSLTGVGNISVTGSSVWNAAQSLITSGNITVGNTGSFTSGTSQTVAGNVTISDSIVFNPSAKLTTVGLITATGASVFNGDAALVKLGGVSVSNTSVMNYLANSTSSGALTINDAAAINLNGHTVTGTSLGGTGGTLNSTTATTLTLVQAGATNFSGNIASTVSLLLNGGTGSLTLSNPANAMAGHLVIGPSGTPTASTSGGTIGIAANGAVNNEIDVFGKVANAEAILLSNGVNFSQPVLWNTPQGSTEIFGVVAGGSATFSGTFTNVQGAGANSTDVANSSVRLGPASPTGSLTLANTFISSTGTTASLGNASLFSSVVLFRNGTTILTGATVNSGTSEVVLGRATVNTITLTNASSIVSNVTSGEGANMGGGASTTTSFVSLDNSQINVGLGTFNINGATSGATTMTLSMADNASVTTGGFTKTDANNSATEIINVTGSTINAGMDNAAFLPAFSGLTVNVDSATINAGSHSINIASAFTDFGSFGGVNYAGTGTIALSNVAANYVGQTTITGVTLSVGTGGTTGSLGSSQITDNGVLMFNHSDVVSFVSTLAGTGGLTMAGGGSLTLGVPISLGGLVTVSGATSVIDFQAGPTTVGGITGTGQAIVDLGVALTSNGATVANLLINGSQTIRHSGGTSEVSTLALGGSPGAWSGKLDLTNNAMVLLNASSSAKAAELATVMDQINSGRNGGTWNGAGGITSSSIPGNANSTMAIVDNAELGATTFRGQTGLDANSIIIGQAALGDVNMDGSVGFADLLKIAQDFGQSGGWAFGHITGDGVVGAVGFADLLLVAQHFGQTLGLLPGGSGDAVGGASSAPVPEPASLTLLALGGAALLTRRRRR